MVDKGYICLRANKEKWDAFALEIRRNKEKIWDVLEPTIEKYIEKSKKKWENAEKGIMNY